jgi:hypothetical protein
VLLILTLALSVGANTAFAATNITNTTSNQINQNTVQNGTNSNTNYAAGSPSGATEVTPKVNFTSSQINDASTRVKSYVETNNKLPSYVTVGTQQVTIPQFLQLITENLLNTGNGQQNPVTLKNVKNPSSATESVKTGNIYTTEYLSLAQSVKSAIDTGTAPSYINSSLGKIKFENIVYTFSKILNYQATNNRLPNYVSTKAWTGQTWTSTTPPVVNNTTTTVPEGPTQTTGSTLKFTSSQINDAASRVISFVGTNHQLPNFVTMGTQQISMPQFLQLLINNLININNGLKTSATTGNINAPTNTSENVKNGNIYQAEYLNLANTIKTTLNTGTAPGYISSSLGNIRFENLVYTFSKITNYQATNNRLPNYVSVSAWTTSTTTTVSNVQAILDTIGYAEAKFRDVQGQSSPTVMAQVGYGDCWADSGWLYNQLSAAGIAVRVMGCSDTGGLYYLHRWAEINIGNGWQVWNYAKYNSQHYGKLGSGPFVVKSST